MTSSPPTAIQAHQLSKRYGSHTVVQNVSFELPAGETLVLLGPSGCGKTTLLRMLNRLVEPDSGHVAIHGQDVRTQPAAELRRGIGYVIQQVGLLPHYTVAENVGVVPRLLGHAPDQVTTRTQELLERLHLPPDRFAGQYPHQLSGGQQQRVGLARALAADPPIILLDEPFGALDPITRASIRREFRELEELRRKTVVLVTHDVTEAFELADRIMLLNAGQVQQLGTPRELLFRPANDFVRTFFEAEQLSLQLRTLRLADVLAHIGSGHEKPAINNYISTDNTLPLSASVQQAIEVLSALAANQPNPAEETVAWVESEKPSPAATLLPLTMPGLMTAFGQALQQAHTV
ncbi:ATP-binding cassette domain-containing protein [Hymenobacter taeanensis]|uniref:ATP-binding cassette domain-containing protein n=1 Tax=Hymenobacter taeanensis TaxID=2735321 RepID=A0A6M6BKD8_9BACT|nr:MULTISPECIES: ATP-binding cassette domain-containing protein [Hymenobacter]QJX48482.1 ATP-binding cassette domain-containing protein [Hymenobacter taeanensis]UOQ82022.1 ATP-binding cassette domain-containing protein [Hymenobacter sp. 5414T-23]